MTSKLPNLIIAGVNKGGTTSLFSYLSAHPDVCASSKKETCYFLPLRYGEQPEPLEQYVQNFKQCGAQKYIMEATPGYFYGGAAVARAIKSQLGDVKIIIILREPTDRLLSFFKFKKSMMELDSSLSFEEYINTCETMDPHAVRRRENNQYWGVQGGFYADYMEDWFDTFGSSLKILFFDQLKSDSSLLLKELCDWLDIDASVYDSLELGVENKTVSYKSGVLHQAALLVNTSGERFLRTYPALKEVGRKFYYALNGKSQSEVISDSTMVRARGYFAPYNKRLTAQLLARGYNNLPKWLG